MYYVEFVTSYQRPEMYVHVLYISLCNCLYSQYNLYSLIQKLAKMSCFKCSELL